MAVFKNFHCLISSCRDKSKPKKIGLPFSEKFLSNLFRHITQSNTTKNEVTGVNLMTEDEQP